MVTVQYGKENKDVIILLHGGGLSWWNFREVAELLQDRYHVIIPILDGHAGSDREFSTIENNAKAIIEYIDEKHNGAVTLIGGVSLGGQILVEMLSQRKDICKYALVESALVLPMRLTHMLVNPMLDMSYGLIRQKWFAKWQFKALRMKKELFDVYYRDTCKVTKENMTAFLKANSCYIIKKELKYTCAKVFIFVGEKESRKMIRSADQMHRLIPYSELNVMKKRYHGEFSLNYAPEYAKTIMKILK